MLIEAKKENFVAIEEMATPTRLADVLLNLNVVLTNTTIISFALANSSTGPLFAS